MKADPILHPDHEEGAYCGRCIDDTDYLKRMDEVDPSLMLRRVADQFPEFEWLAWLPPEERRWYLTVGDQDYIRQAFFPHLPPWAMEALQS